MEILKNFLVGLLVIGAALVILSVSVILVPFIIIAGSLVMLSLKVLVFVTLCVFFVILIGYLARTGLRQVPKAPKQDISG